MYVERFRNSPKRIALRKNVVVPRVTYGVRDVAKRVR